LDADKTRRVAAVDYDRMRIGVGDRDDVADLDRQLTWETVVGAPAQGDLDQPGRQPLDLRRAQKIPCARLQYAGLAVHDPEEAVGDGGEEGGIVGVTGVDLDRDLCCRLVESCNGALREWQRIVIDREVADRDMAARGDQQRRIPRR